MLKRLFVKFLPQIFLVCGLVVLIFLVGLVLPEGSMVKNRQISGIVIPHHSLVATVREEFLKKLTTEINAPKTIILVSPNHFNYGAGMVQTTTQDWKLTDDVFVPEKETIGQLLASKVVSYESASFQDEIGIKLVLEDLHGAFPNAKLVPIIIKEGTSEETIDNLNSELNKICSTCLMVASVDFSHYQPTLLANLHDELTLRALNNLDNRLLANKAEVDSPATLALLALWAKSHNTRRFSVFRHTNSGVLVGNPDMETTSHFFGWYEKGQQTTSKNAISFIFAGDAMFSRGIAQKFERQGFDGIFAQLGDRVFWGTDVSVINLEGVIDDKLIENNFSSDNLVFRFSEKIIPTLTKFLRINIVSQGNNHSDNAGANGFAKSKELLEKAGIGVVGGPATGDANNIKIIKGQEKNLYLISVNALAPFEDIRGLIKKGKENKANAVIILSHWGQEYSVYHNEAQEKMAHSWIDAGADLIIGTHPHVIQDLEVYRGRPIVYSLGNFVFDQTFSLETQRGLFVVGNFNDAGLTLFFLPVESKNIYPRLLTGSIKNDILTKLYRGGKMYLKNTEAGNVLFFPF